MGSHAAVATASRRKIRDSLDLANMSTSKALRVESRTDSTPSSYSRCFFGSTTFLEIQGRISESMDLLLHQSHCFGKILIVFGSLECLSSGKSPHLPSCVTAGAWTSPPLHEQLGLMLVASPERYFRLFREHCPQNQCFRDGRLRGHIRLIRTNGHSR